MTVPLNVPNFPVPTPPPTTQPISPPVASPPPSNLAGGIEDLKNQIEELREEHRKDRNSLSRWVERASFYAPGLLIILVGISITFYRIKNFFDIRRQVQVKHRNEHLSDIYGYPGVVDDARKLVHLIKRQSISSTSHSLKGVIINGPPGVAKSLLVNAIAGDSGAPIITLDGHQLTNDHHQYHSILQTTARRVTTLNSVSPLSGEDFDRTVINYLNAAFAKASQAAKKEKKTCILHLRHLSVFPLESEVLNTLIANIDKYKDNVLVIGSTSKNYKKFPERLIHQDCLGSYVISIPSPDKVENRKDILEGIFKEDSYSSKKGNDLNFKTLAEQTDEFSGAELRGVAEEARRLASLSDSPTINMEHFDEAILIKQYGLVSKVKLKSNPTSAIAHYIVGQGIIARALGYEIQSVSLQPRIQPSGELEHHLKQSQGHVCIYLSGRSETLQNSQDYLQKILFLVAGRAGEEILLKPSEYTNTNKEDIADAKELVKKMLNAGMLYHLEKAAWEGKTPEDKVDAVINKAIEVDKKIINELKITPQHRIVTDWVSKHTSLPNKVASNYYTEVIGDLQNNQRVQELIHRFYDNPITSRL